MPDLVHVEITAADVPATARFYAGVLGAGVEPSPFMQNYTLLSTPEGPVGAVMDKSYRDQPVIAWFSVDDLDAALARVAETGGKPVGAINTIPGQGRLSYASDPNGTLFGLRQPG